MTEARRAAVALAVIFALFGILVGTWLSRIPAVKATVGLDNRALGLALLGAPLGSVLASVLLPRQLVRTGSKTVIVSGGIVSAFALVLPGVARTGWELAAAVFVFGFSSGGLDIAVNTHGAAVERALGGSIFGRLHASWSAGAFAGAALGAIAAAVDLDVRVHFAVIALAVAIGVYALRSRLLDSSIDRGGHEQTQRAWSLQPVVVALGVIALVGFVVESAVGDWAAVYLHEDLGTTAAVGAAGYATFAAVHVVGRLFGDRVLSRVRRAVVMQVGCVTAAVGYGVLLGPRNVVTAFIGLAAIAAGIAAVVPAAFGAAGRLHYTSAAAGVGTVTGISYVGWAGAPPLIGVLAGHFTLRAALVVPLVLAVLGAMVAGALRARVRLVGDADAHPTAATPR